MVALFLPADAAQQLALDAALLPPGCEVLPASELHVTLAMLGNVADQAPDARDAVLSVLQVAAGCMAMSGRVNGLGRFASPDGALQPVYLSFDAPALAEFRQHLVEMLGIAGVGLSYAHGFVPHITLAYLPADVPTPHIPQLSMPIEFDGLTLAWGDVRTTVPYRELATLKADDLERWERKATKRLKDRKPAACAFVSDYIAEEEAAARYHELEHADSVAAIKAALKAMPLTEAEQELYDRLLPILQRYGLRTLRQLVAGETEIDLAALEAELRAALLPSIAEVMQATAAGLAEEIGPDLDPAELATVASAQAAAYSYELVSGLTETTRKVVAGAMVQWAATPGMTREQLERLLRPAFGPVRAEMIAVTEVTRSASMATDYYQRYLLEHGIDMERWWDTNNDDRVCLVCGPLHNQPEAVWIERFPKGSPAHVKCRCVIRLRRRKVKRGAA